MLSLPLILIGLFGCTAIIFLTMPGSSGRLKALLIIGGFIIVILIATTLFKLAGPSFKLF